MISGPAATAVAAAVVRKKSRREMPRGDVLFVLMQTLCSGVRFKPSRKRRHARIVHVKTEIGGARPEPAREGARPTAGNQLLLVLGGCGLTGSDFFVRLKAMKAMPLVHRAAVCVFLFAGFITQLAQAEWQRDDKTIAWSEGTNVLWRFSFDASKGKTFFDPLNVNGRALTNFKPEDHPWHYGLWFSWKYINKANYWEEERGTGKAEGATRWMPPKIETQPDGSASIKLLVSYTHPSGRVDLMESRELNISTPKSDGSYSIDWRANFKAGKEGAVLDRTPMPNDPDGKVNGGYAGLGLRMAAPPLTFSAVCSTGVVSRFVSERARPFAPAVAFNFGEGEKVVGGIAIFNDPANPGNNAWYIVNSSQMRFACAAVLAPHIITLKPAEEMKLHYRIVVQPKAWTPETLRE